MINYVISQLPVQTDPVQRLGSRLLSTFANGRVRPRFGTRNFTMHLQNGQCSGFVYPLNHPAVVRALWDKAIAKKKQEGGRWRAWVFSGEDILKVEEKFSRSAIEGHRTHPDGSFLKWKQISFNQITDYRELQFSVQLLTANHPSQDRIAVVAINKIPIAYTDRLSDSWFKTEILDGLNIAVNDCIDLSTNNGDCGIVSVHLTATAGPVVLD
jgi:hypothetical protein